METQAEEILTQEAPAEETPKAVEAPMEAAVEPVEKPPAEMNERELLQALLERQIQNEKLNRITAIALTAMAVVLLIAVLILIPLATHTLNQAYDTLSDAQTTALQAQTALSRVTELSENAQDSLDTLNLLAERAEESLDAVDAMIENVNGLVEDNTGALQETIQKLNAIDFEKFSNSINQLNEVIGPLAKLFAR
jgi:predicted PurR-regulated permease PerM